VKTSNFRKKIKTNIIYMDIDVKERKKMKREKSVARSKKRKMMKGKEEM